MKRLFPSTRARLTLLHAAVLASAILVADVGGAGLGLALSRAIAQAHAGTLDLVEAGGPGATFRLFLPAFPNGNINATVSTGVGGATR